MPKNDIGSNLLQCGCAGMERDSFLKRDRRSFTIYESAETAKMIVKFFANVRDITKSKEIEIKAPDDIMQLLLLMSEKYGLEMRKKLISDENRLHPDMIVLLNGRHIEHLQEERSKLSDEDTVSFFPRIAGG